jgi:hypothetical protein
MRYHNFFAYTGNNSISMNSCGQSKQSVSLLKIRRSQTCSVFRVVLLSVSLQYSAFTLYRSDNNQRPSLRTVHSLHTYGLYIQSIHIDCTFSPYTRTVHSVHTYGLYIQSIHTDCTFSSYIWTVHSVHTHACIYALTTTRTGTYTHFCKLL